MSAPNRKRPTMVDRLRKAAFYDAAEHIEDLEGAIRQYLREMDAPVPDYSLRRLYREHMRTLIDPENAPAAVGGEG